MNVNDIEDLTFRVLCRNTKTLVVLESFCNPGSIFAELGIDTL